MQGRRVHSFLFPKPQFSHPDIIVCKQACMHQLFVEHLICARLLRTGRQQWNKTNFQHSGVYKLMCTAESAGTDVPQLGRPSGKAGAAAVLFFYGLFFKASFRFMEKLRGRFGDFPYAPCPPNMHSLGGSGLFVEIDEPTLTRRHHHPEFSLH